MMSNHKRSQLSWSLLFWKKKQMWKVKVYSTLAFLSLKPFCWIFVSPDVWNGWWRPAIAQRQLHSSQSTRSWCSWFQRRNSCLNDISIKKGGEYEFIFLIPVQFWNTWRRWNPQNKKSTNAKVILAYLSNGFLQEPKYMCLNMLISGCWYQLCTFPGFEFYIFEFAILWRRNVDLVTCFIK